MTDDDWFDWQMRMLLQRIEHFAQILRAQLCVAASLFEQAQSRFVSPRPEMRPTDAVQMKRSAPEAPKSSTPLSLSPPKEVEMRSVDEIVATAQKALDASVREAFAAGQRQVASDLRHKMEALFEGLIESGLSHVVGEATAPSENHSHDHERHSGG
jgi:hypothetical protein